jgi:signal transduction histidine kinase
MSDDGSKLTEQTTSDTRLALLDDLRQAERRAVSSRVASIIGHLIGTPLHVIGGRASLIRSSPTPESAVENAQRIEEQVERLARRIRALIEYLTAPEPDVQLQSVNVVIEDAVSLYEPIGTVRGSRVRLSGEPPPNLSIDGRSALIVLTSLISLATRCASPGSTISLIVEQKEPASVTFELQVPGMKPPPGRIDRLEPPDQWNRDEAEQLQVFSVCFAIARRSGGRIEVDAQAGHTSIRFYCVVSG